MPLLAGKRQKDDMEKSDLFLTCRHDIYRGAIPLQIDLAASDSSSSFHSNRALLLVSRYAYLTEVSKEIVEYFRTNAVEFDASVWFDCEGQVIKR